MQETAFSEKLYTSTEVAQILGVSLRSIYRYLDENKIQAAVKTATGRHRFTKQNINDFLHPTAQKSGQMADRPAAAATGEEAYKPSYYDTAKPDEHKADKESVSANRAPEVDDATVKDEPVDWLAKFRQAAEKYKTQEMPTRESPAQSTQVWSEPEVAPEEVGDGLEESEFNYYRSGVGGLKEIAQSLDKSAKNASLDYAFTMQAGLSLHKPIKPFSLINAYIRPGDKAYFERVLQLSPSTKDTAQLCLAPSNQAKLYKDRKEMHGLQVVSDEQLKLDLLTEGETDLANELD
jgi:excisionase family DNA binding protein